MALASGITSVPNAAIVLALPTIHRHFDASLTELEWTVTGYLLAYSALLIAAGRLADVFGRVRLLTVGDRALCRRFDSGGARRVAQPC